MRKTNVLVIGGSAIFLDRNKDRELNRLDKIVNYLLAL
jgi:hypothetical protein